MSRTFVVMAPKAQLLKFLEGAPMDETSFVLEQSDKAGCMAFKVLKGKLVVGRDPSCDIVLNDGSVSRLHAEIHFDGQIVRVRDLGSRNGTFVASRGVDEAPLALGERVKFGNIEFVLANKAAHPPEVETASVDNCSESNTVRNSPSANLLSDAQQRVFKRLLLGKSEKEVAFELKVSRHTVHRHICNIYRLLEVNSRSELLALFVAHSDVGTNS
jgi:pSer/pThr/pTyr-binding forkhead associated (FHA) protein